MSDESESDDESADFEPEDLPDDVERNQDGDLIKKRSSVPWGGQPTETWVNLSKLYRPGDRTTTNVEHLIIEAEKAAREGESVGNPAYPKDEETRKRALRRLDDMGLSPAWDQTPSRQGGGGDG